MCKSIDKEPNIEPVEGEYVIGYKPKTLKELEEWLKDNKPDGTV